MRRSKFAEEQIIAILKEQEAGVSVGDITRKYGISSQIFYRWKSKYGGMEVSEARRLKALEDENQGLKRLVADLTLDNTALEDVLGKRVLTLDERRQAAHWLVERHEGLSARRACALMGVHRSSHRYEQRMPSYALLRAKLKTRRQTPPNYVARRSVIHNI